MRWALAQTIFMAAMPLLAASPPASAAYSCSPGPYIIFFEPDTSVLKREQVEVLDSLIEAASNCGSATPYLAAHADTAEDRSIVKDRLRAVRTYLASRGIFVRREHARTFGTMQPRVETGLNVPERQNRRVEIMYGPSTPSR